MKTIKHLARRSLAVLLTVVMCFGLLNLTAFAANDNGGHEGWDWGGDANQHWKEHNGMKEAYGPHVDEDGDGYCDECERASEPKESEEREEPGKNNPSDAEYEWHYDQDGHWKEKEHGTRIFEGPHECTEKVITAATCENEGEAEYTCRCGYSYKGPIEKLGHDWKLSGKIDATCTTGGSVTYKCTRCVETKTEALDALGHQEKVTETAATCTTGAYKTHTCINANCTYSYTETVSEALGHEYDGGVVTKAAACTVDGTRTYTCERCGDKRTETIPAAHQWVEIDREEPTCEKEGHVAYRYCKVCPATEDEATIETLGHKYDDGVVTKTAACTVDGTMTYTCERCGDKKTESIPASHQWMEVGREEPTCTKDGHEAGQYCKVCPAIQGQDIIRSTGHKWVVLEQEDPTCTEDGREGGRYCGICDEKEGLNVIHAAGHDMRDVGAKPATCTEDGYVAYKACANCDHTEGYEEIPAGHTNVVTDEAVAPTCTATGLTEGSHCAACGTVLVEQKTVDMLSHTVATPEGKPATCTATGLTGGEVCSVCGKTLTEQEVVAALEHDMRLIRTEAAACEADGHEYYECSRCGHTDEKILPATGHDMKDVGAVAATCTEDGYVAYKACANCTHTEGYEEIPAGHTSVVTDEAVAATCTATGLTEGSHCAACGTVLVEQRTVDMLPHTVVTPEGKPATCTATGLTGGAECSVCGKTLTEQEVVAALEHDMRLIRTEAAACEADGHEYYECSRCGHTDEETLPATGHNWGGWIVEIPATATTDGLMVNYCTNANCDVYQLAIIPAAGEDNTEIPEEDPPLSDQPDIEIPEEDPPLSDQPDIEIPEEDPPLSDQPDIEIPEEDPPLGDQPDIEIPEEDPPLGDQPDIEIPEEDPPLSDQPDIDIPEEDPPLADVPQTGDSSGIWLITTAMSAAGLIVLALTDKRKDEEA